MNIEQFFLAMGLSISGYDILVWAMLLFAVILILKAVKQVPQGFNWTVERFGGYTRTLEPGLRVIVPLIDSIGHKASVQERVLDIAPQEVITADNAQVTTDAVCFFQVLDAAKACYEVANLDLAMKNLVMTNIRAVLGAMELDSMLSSRDKINQSLLTKIDDATAPWGVKVNRIEIKDLSPNADLVDAMAAQMKAEREKRAQILAAEGQKQAAIEVAEGERQAQILRAEGEKQAAFLEAEARERQAQAEAKATQVVSDAISNGDPQALNYFVAQKYTEALQEIGSAPNSKMVMVPLEASSLMGSISGIGELLKGVNGAGHQSK